MTKRKRTKGQTRYIKHTHKAKDRVTRTPIKDGCTLRCSGMVSNFCSIIGKLGVNLDNSWTMEGTGTAYDKWNIFVVICDITVNKVMVATVKPSMGVRVTRSLALCVCFIYRVCPFVLFLLFIVLSVLLRFMDSDYSLGIIKPFLFILYIWIFVYRRYHLRYYLIWIDYSKCLNGVQLIMRNKMRL
jgi:hypothetical protein